MTEEGVHPINKYFSTLIKSWVESIQIDSNFGSDGILTIGQKSIALTG